MTGQDKNKTPTKGEERVLRALWRLCDHGVSPPHKAVARQAGVNFNNIPAYYARLRGKGLIEKKLDCWRPTEAGRAYVGDDE